MIKKPSSEIIRIPLFKYLELEHKEYESKETIVNQEKNNNISCENKNTNIEEEHHKTCISVEIDKTCNEANQKMAKNQRFSQKSKRISKISRKKKHLLNSQILRIRSKSKVMKSMNSKITQKTKKLNLLNEEKSKEIDIIMPRAEVKSKNIKVHESNVRISEEEEEKKIAIEDQEESNFNDNFYGMDIEELGEYLGMGGNLFTKEIRNSYENKFIVDSNQERNEKYDYLSKQESLFNSNLDRSSFQTIKDNSLQKEILEEKNTFTEENENKKREKKDEVELGDDFRKIDESDYNPIYYENENYNFYYAPSRFYSNFDEIPELHS